ncbi:MAG: sigma-70 family RNA polymerase sigma factor [Patescibacteria group bacterium]
MKVINSKRSEFEIFENEKNEYIGFSGMVSLYEMSLFIDTRNGTGYDKVIKKLAPLIHKFTKRFHHYNSSVEDLAQDVAVHILEGIPKYDPRKDMKLSSFLEMRINRRLINDLRDMSRVRKNATFLNISFNRVTCECGYAFNTKQEISKTVCMSCGKIGQFVKKNPCPISEVNESTLSANAEKCSKGEEIALDSLSLVDFGFIGNIQQNVDDAAISKCDIFSWIENEDPKLAEIIDLICFHDYTINDAATKVGLTKAGVSIKLKKLKDNERAKELLNR